MSATEAATPQALALGNITPIPGQLWPEHNALYAGIIPSDDGSTAWHLIVPVGPEYALKEVAWGEYGQNVVGADSRFDGLANTVAMAAAGSALAQSIRALPGGDCYIPSRAELALCQVILHAHFESDWHWSSTQYSANYAWYQYFGGGYQDDYGGKGAELRCRAVRRLVIQSFNPLDAGATGAA